MPNSIDFHKGIFLHVILARIIVLCYERSNHDLNFIRILPEKFFFLRDALGSSLVIITLKLNTSVSKGLKRKVRMFLKLIPKFVEIKGAKLVEGGYFCLPLPHAYAHPSQIELKGLFSLFYYSFY